MNNLFIPLLFQLLSSNSTTEDIGNEDIFYNMNI